MDLGVMASAVSGCGGMSGTWGPWMEGQNVGAFWQIHPDGVVGGSVAIIVLGEFCAQATGLDAHHGIDLRIEVGLSAKDFGGDLVFLERDAWMIHGVFGDIAQKLAEGFRAVQNRA